MPRVLVVEDDDFTRTMLAGALAHAGMTVVGAVPGARTAMDALLGSDVDCAVLDLDLGPGPTGIDLAHGLRQRRPEIGIVILTSFSDPRLLSGSLKELPTGSAFVVKQSLADLALLVEAIDAAIAHAGTGVPSNAAHDLTDAQIETLRLLAGGLTNAEIARVRVVTEKSVEQAIARTAKRLGIDVTPSSSQPNLNQRVALARAYYRLTGATRDASSQR